MVIRQTPVSMRTSNFHLNASQILTAAKVEHNRRAHYLGLLKQRGVLSQAPRHNAWVPFEDGAFLCQAIGLDGELQPLLSHANLPIPAREEENYFLRPTVRPTKLANGYFGMRQCRCCIPSL